MNKYFPLIISVIINAIILFSYFPKSRGLKMPAESPVLVKITEKKEIVVTDYVNNEVPDELFAYGKFNQKVVQETKGSSSVFKNLVTPSTTGKGSTSNVATSDDLPLNDISLLNTKEFAYWNYYQDVRERIEHYWGRSIESLARSFGNRQLASSQNATHLKVVISHNGRIETIIMERPSGVVEFDTAAIDAFNKAGPFPNPPQGILRGGRAVIEWRFIVNA